MTTTETGANSNKWIWIGLVAAALFCLCAAAIAGFLLLGIGRQVQQGVKTDPESSSRAAHKIVDGYELPPDYREQMSMDFLIYSFVMIGPDLSARSNAPIIMLAQFETGMDQEQAEQQLRRSFEQQSGRRGLNMELVEVKKMMIRGVETDVAIYEGADNNQTAMRQLIAAFPGKGGTAMLIIMGNVQEWNQVVMDDFIKSIR
jgi:hypothetical protein